MLLAAAVTACVRGAPSFIGNECAAMLARPREATAAKLHATLLLRSALGAPQGQAVGVRTSGFASPTAADARDGSRIHIHFVA